MLFSFYSIFIDPLLSRLRNWIIDFSGAKSGDMVLDIGCGTGDQVFYCTRYGMVATGIDQNPKMIKVASHLKAKYNLLTASFCLASAGDLPFKTGIFDYALASLILHESDRTRRDQIIREMQRVVKTNGILVFIDFKTPLPKNVLGLSIRSIEFLVGKVNYGYFCDYLLQGGIENLLRRNGFLPLKTARFFGTAFSLVTARNF